ncbi:MAG: response regulator, partial [Candidatus Zixiibacteriota bacterium]
MNETVNKLKVLIVDDESIVLSLVRDALEDENYEILTAARSLEALKILKAEKIDLVVTDIRMPDMNGIDMVRKARSIQPDIGVIFMTGYANLNSAKDAIKQGALDYILKPFELDEIRRAVNKAAQKLQKEAAEKDSGQQIDRLSDLTHLLVTVAERP